MHSDIISAIRTLPEYLFTPEIARAAIESNNIYALNVVQCIDVIAFNCSPGFFGSKQVFGKRADSPYDIAMHGLWLLSWMVGLFLIVFLYVTHQSSS